MISTDQHMMKSWCSQLLGNATIVEDNIEGSIGVKFGVRLICV